jgi:hypothetical protein
MADVNAAAAAPVVARAHAVANPSPAVVTGMPPSIGNRVSYNVDLDEEKLLKAAGMYRPPVHPVSCVSAAAQRPPHMVNGLLDLDNEITQ